MQSPQAVHSESSTAGRLGATSSAPCGHVAMQAPQPVHLESIETVDQAGAAAVIAGTRGA
jgi:hypothetical protein